MKATVSYPVRTSLLTGATLLVALVVACSGRSHAQTPLVTEIIDTTYGYPKYSGPCRFDRVTLHGDDAFYDPVHPSYTSCHELQVSGCPNSLPALKAYVGVTAPSASKGTIVLFDGAGGQTFFNHGGINSSGLFSTYVGDYYAFPYTVVQVAWAGPWEDNSNDPPVKSVKDEACRPATLMSYINSNYAGGGRMCAQGHSAGSAAIAYSLAHYGADRGSSGGYLDTVVLTSGPPFSDIKAGCQYPNLPGTTTVCANSKCVGGASTPSFQSCLQYPNGVSDCLSNLYPTGTQSYQTAKAVSNMTIGPPTSTANNCTNYTGSGISSSPYYITWTNMSLVSSGANYNYPKTNVYGFLCWGPDTYKDSNNNQYTLSNNSAGQGWTYLNQLVTGNSTGIPAIYRVDNCDEPEMIWGDGATAEGTGNPALSGFIASESAMINNCRSPQ